MLKLNEQSYLYTQPNVQQLSLRRRCLRLLAQHRRPRFLLAQLASIIINAVFSICLGKTKRSLQLRGKWEWWRQYSQQFDAAWPWQSLYHLRSRLGVTAPIQRSAHAQLAHDGGSDTWFAAILERTSYWFKFKMNRNLKWVLRVFKCHSVKLLMRSFQISTKSRPLLVLPLFLFNVSSCGNCLWRSHRLCWSIDFFFDFNIASEAMASISIGPAHGNRFFVHS